MATVSIARRYARALFEAESHPTAPGGGLNAASEQLWQLTEMFKTQPELAQVFANPAFAQAQRIAVASRLLETLGDVPASLAGMVKLLVARDRMLLLPDIARLFRDMVDAGAGRVRGEVTTAVALSREQLGQLEKALQRAVQRDIILQAKVDPGVLGGVTARVGSLLFDGSIRSQLEQLRQQLHRA